MIDTTHIENNILGTLIMWPERYHDINQVAYPFMFSEKNRALADYLFAAISEGQAVELGVVVQDAQAQKLSTASHVLAITQAPAMDDVVTHCHKLREAYQIQEDSKRYNNALKALLNGEEYEKVRARFDSEFEALQAMIEVKADTRFDDIRGAYDHLIKGLDNDGLNGVPTGFADIDAHTGGWQAGNFILLGARPAMGKTTISLDFAFAAAEAGVPTAFFSLEMTKREVYFKLAAKRAGIPPGKMIRSDVSPADLPKVWPALEYVSELPLYVFDDTSIDNTLPSIRDKARQVQREHGLGLIVVDYIQLMSGPEKQREERVGEISKGFKWLAKQMNIPAIILSQLSRDVEKRGGAKRPMLSDLRESGSLEQDADIIIFPYRPEYYEILEDEDGRKLEGQVELIFAKHRMGTTTSFWSRYVPQRDTYLDRYQPAEPFPAPDSRPAPASIPASSRPGRDDEIPF